MGRLRRQPAVLTRVEPESRRADLLASRAGHLADVPAAAGRGAVGFHQGDRQLPVVAGLLAYGLSRWLGRPLAVRLAGADALESGDRASIGYLAALGLHIQLEAGLHLREVLALEAVNAALISDAPEA